MRRKIRTIETDVFGYEVQENPINSKKKGDKNERTAAKWLSEWTGVPFTRVPRSGGLRWKNTANVCGDVVCEDQDFKFPFVVETKHLKRITFTKYLRGNSRIYSIFEQVKEDAQRADKLPLMILRKDGMPAGTYVVFFTFTLSGVVEVCSGGSLYGYNSQEILSNVKFVELIKNL